MMRADIGCIREIAPNKGCETLVMGQDNRRSLVGAALFFSMTLGVLAFFSTTVGSNAADSDIWKALRSGGHVILMRHATAPGTGDPEGFQLGDCTTQRNLDQKGRLQARATGLALRENGVMDVEVRASQWCRTKETAELLEVGSMMVDPALNSFFSNPDRRGAQTAAIRSYIANVKPGSPVRILVTHQVNITALTGIYPRSGEIVVVLPTQKGGEVIGQLGPFGL